MGQFAAAATVVSSLMSMQQAQKAAGLQAAGIKEQAQMEKLRANDEGIARRERLLNALAAQTAQAGAGGVTGGSLQQVQEKSVKDYTAEQKSADVYGAAVQSGARRNAAGAIKQGRYRAVGSLLSAGTALSEIG
jgi:hypothetical protein